jgi:hypothetical protein
VRYYRRMKSKPNARETLSPFANFTKAMDDLMKVPHSEIKKALDREKRAKERKKRIKNRPASSGHVSGENG